MSNPVFNIANSGWVTNGIADGPSGGISVFSLYSWLVASDVDNFARTFRKDGAFYKVPSGRALIIVKAIFNSIVLFNAAQEFRAFVSLVPYEQINPPIIPADVRGFFDYRETATNYSIPENMRVESDYYLSLMKIGAVSKNLHVTLFGFLINSNFE